MMSVIEHQADDLPGRWPAYLTGREARQALGLTIDEFRQLRERGRGPPQVKLASHRLLYRADEFEQWRAERGW
jgi:hypothetical protein